MWKIHLEKAAIKDSIDKINEHNYQLQYMLHTQAEVAAVVENLYQVKVVVCKELCEELKLSRCEKRGHATLS